MLPEVLSQYVQSNWKSQQGEGLSSRFSTSELRPLSQLLITKKYFSLSAINTPRPLSRVPHDKHTVSER
ncbi:hypothetical protein KPH14_011143 [Odynerus spinipes]|uniref:Uncharacterized protein n=1 Tax=Odynerus spinipes TaxID=1348599 RepID=A0AAD9RFX2_9HYME|nr:hypothetical protein KPH14_011143 [Odynerus spinipes]